MTSPAKTRPAILTASYWSAKKGAILIGFVLTMLGSLGGQFYVQPAQDDSNAFDQRSKAIAADIDTLKTAQAQYLMFQQQGALIYALNVAALSSQPNQKSVVNNLYQLALIDRAGAMRSIITALGSAHLLDADEMGRRYGVLIQTARKDVSLDTYSTIDDLEKTVVDQANARMKELQQGLVATSSAKSGADAVADQRKLTLLILGTVGATFLLAANLLSTRESKAPEAIGEAQTVSEPNDDPQRILELTTAQQILTLAIEHAERLNGKSATNP